MSDDAAITSLDEMKEWPKETILKLFDLVKPHPVLYDPSSDGWSNTTQKGKIWTSVAKELDPYLNSKKCRDRFVTYRKRYGNQIRKEISTGGTNFDEELLWLMSDDEKENNVSKASETIKTEPSTNDQENDVESGIHSDEDQPPPARSPELEEFLSTLKSLPQSSTGGEVDSNNGEPPIKRPKRKASAPQKVASSLEPQSNNVPASNMNFFDVLSSFQTMQHQHFLDEECIIFGRQVELDLRRLSTPNRALARVKIAEIMAELIQKQF